MNYNHPCLNIRNKYMIVNHFKDFKKVVNNISFKTNS